MKKEILLPILKFWGYFVIIPFVLAIILGKIEMFFFARLLGSYVLFFAPVLFFFFPYNETKKYTKKATLVVIFSLVVPYLFIYLFIIYGFLKTLENFGF